jgi:hypothetical protein
MRDRTQILLGSAIFGVAILNVFAVVTYNRRIRQSEFDTLLKMIESGSTINIKGVGGAFDKEYWKKSNKKPNLTFDEANRLAVKIYDAKSRKGIVIRDWWRDDEESVGDVFRMLKSKSDVSLLSDAFYQKYRTELITFLESFMTEKELNEFVISYISKLS